MIFKQRVLVMHIVSALPIILAYLFNKYICILYFRGKTLPCLSPAASAMLSFTLLPGASPALLIYADFPPD